MRSLAAALALLLLAGGCSDGDDGDFCDRLGALSDLEELGRSSIDVDAFRDVREQLADLDPPPDLAPDVDALITLYDIVIDRLGEIDLRDPTPEQLAELQVIQQDLESSVLAADASLARISDARADCLD